MVIILKAGQLLLNHIQTFSQLLGATPFGFLSLLLLLNDPSLYPVWLQFHKILTGELLRVELQFLDIFFLQIQVQWNADNWICSLLRSQGQTKSWTAFTHTILGGSCDFRQEASNFLNYLVNVMVPPELSQHHHSLFDSSPQVVPQASIYGPVFHRLQDRSGNGRQVWMLHGNYQWKMDG